MMLGAEEDVIVTGSIPDGVTVTSGGPVSVQKTLRSCCAASDVGSPTCRTVVLGDACEPNEETASLTVSIRASFVTEGWSDLSIRKSNGAVWAGVRLSVERAASLGLVCDLANPVTVASLGWCNVTWNATGASGEPLMSTSAIFLTSSDPTVAVFGVFLDMNVNEGNAVAAPGVTIEGRQPGDATITAIGGGVTELLRVHVTP
jgi:hypothetical protein